MAFEVKKYSRDKNINELVKRLLKHYGWKLKKQNRHPVSVSPSGQQQTIPCTPSDYRAFKNFKHDIRRLQGI